MASTTHDKGVAAAKAWLKGEGFTLEGAPTVGGHVADAYGKKSKPNNKVDKTMVEVETGDSIAGQDAKDQMKAFAAWAKEFSSRNAVLFVPEDRLEDAKKALPNYDLYGTY